MRTRPSTVLAFAAHAAGLLLVAAAAFWSAQWLQVVAVAENWSEDVRAALLTPAAPQHPEIVVLTITERTLATLPARSPIDRGFLAGLLDTLEAAGVRAVGLDILFDKPTDAGRDAHLHARLRDFPVPVVAAWAERRDGLTAEQSTFLDAYLDGVGRGQAALLKDPHDDVVRWLPEPRQTTDTPVPAFAAALARSVGVSGPDGSMALVYRGRPDAETPPFAAFEAHTAHLLPRAWLAGRIALVGADLPDADRFRTPRSSVFGSLGRTVPGVFIHAHGLAQILDGTRRPETGAPAAFAVVLAMTALGLLVARLEIAAAAQIAIAATALAAFWAAGFAVFAQAGAQLPLVAPSLGFAVAASAAGLIRGARHRAQKQFIRGAFAHYVPPEVVSSLLAEPDALVLGGEKRELTMVFTDIAAFTAVAERMEPAELVPMLNAYLDGMSRIVLDHGGTIDKFVGDAVIALFGVPGVVEDHPARAVACAVALDAFARAFAAEQDRRGVAFGATRIGVHTGTAVVGNFGGAARFDYTAVGDAVNVAARLEGANKFLGTTVCVSGACAERCPGRHFRPMGDLVLKGRSQPTRVFEPLPPGRAGDAAAAAYHDAFTRLEAGAEDAAAAFAALHAKAPDDALVAFHHRRLAAGGRGTTIVLEDK